MGQRFSKHRVSKNATDAQGSPQSYEISLAPQQVRILEPYSYSSLVGRSGEIRVLELYLHDDDSPLCGAIKHEHLSALSGYGALSYVWGNPQATETLIVDDKHFCMISKSLAQALRDFRTWARSNAGSACPGYVHRCQICADAVCIDQSNLDERVEQVLLMGQIYSRANVVAIYTGPALPGGAEFCRFVEGVELWGMHRAHTGQLVTPGMQAEVHWPAFGLPGADKPPTGIGYSTFSPMSGRPAHGSRKTRRRFRSFSAVPTRCDISRAL